MKPQNVWIIFPSLIIETVKAAAAADISLLKAKYTKGTAQMSEFLVFVLEQVKNVLALHNDAKEIEIFNAIIKGIKQA